MKTIFSIEAPRDDQQTLYQFEQENKIVEDSSYPKLTIDRDDWIAIFYKATNGKFYLERHFCGCEIYLDEFESEKEYQLHLRIFFFDYCQLQFLEMSKEEFLKSQPGVSS